MRVLSCLLSVFAVLETASAAETSDLRRTWTLYHATDPSKGEKGFAKRGSVILEPGDNEIKLSVENDEGCFSEKDLEDMMNSGFYQIKLVENGPDAKSIESVMTTVPACTLRRANFRDELTLIFGQKGHVMSIAYSPLVSPLAKPCDELSTPPEIQFNSRVEYEAAVPGMVLKNVLSNYQPPPGLKFLPGKGKAAGAGGAAGSSDAKPEGFEDKKEEEAPMGIMGMMQKYWYIILPLMIMNLISAEAPQDQQGQGAAGGNGASSSQAAPPAAAGSGGTGKRRGKRG